VTTTFPDDVETPEDMDALEWKALPTAEMTSPLTGVIGHDDADGTITALVAVSGVVDEVGDVIVPGSLATAIKRLKPKGVMSHNWSAKVSRLVWSKELMPGDPQLPRTTPQGEPWPANAGGLLIKAKYNLDKEIGRDAYADAKFYGPEECFSIGYKVRPGGYRMRSGKRYLHDYDLYEWSQVLHGAHKLAHLTGVKSLSETVADAWYDDPRSGVTDEGTTVLDGVEYKGIRVVRDAEFWGMPLGTPIKAGMRPRSGQTPTTAQIAATTAPGSADAKPEVPGKPGVPGAAGVPGAPGDPALAPLAPPGPGVPKALAALHQRYQELNEQVQQTPAFGDSSLAENSLAMLAQFAAPGADVHASTDGQLAAVHGPAGWTIVDTANAGSGLSNAAQIPPDAPPDQIDAALEHLTQIGIPWDDIEARKKRWANAKQKTADQQAVRDVLSQITPFSAPAPVGEDDAAGARDDAESAIATQDRDGLAEALTRMGLPPDQDPREMAASLLVLPSEVAAKRLDAVAAQAVIPQVGAAPDGGQQKPGVAGPAPTVPPGAAPHANPPAPVKPNPVGTAHADGTTTVTAGANTIPGGHDLPQTPPAAPEAPAAPADDRKYGTPVLVNTYGVKPGSYPTVKASEVRTGDHVMLSRHDGGKVTQAKPGRTGQTLITYDDGTGGGTQTRGVKNGSALPLVSAGTPAVDPSKPQAAPEHEYKPTGNHNAPEKLTDAQLAAESEAAHKRHMAARSNNLPKNSLEYSDSKLAATRFGDEARRRAAATVAESTPAPEVDAHPLVTPAAPDDAALLAQLSGHVTAPQLSAALATIARDQSDPALAHAATIARGSLDSPSAKTPEKLAAELIRVKNQMAQAPDSATLHATLDGLERIVKALKADNSKIQVGGKARAGSPQRQLLHENLAEYTRHVRGALHADENPDKPADQPPATAPEGTGGPEAKPDPLRPAPGQVNYTAIQKRSHPAYRDAALRQLDDAELASVKREAARRGGHGANMADSVHTEEIRRRITPDELRKRADKTGGGASDGEAKRMRDRADDYERRDAAGIGRHDFAALPLGEHPKTPESTGGEVPEGTPDGTVPVPPEVADSAHRIRGEALGLTDGPDGQEEVTQEVADRQERVAALLETGETGLADQTDPQLHETRKDLTDELALQDELHRRDTERKREAAVKKAEAGASSVSATDAPAGPEDTGPKVRPGVAGAAEDLGDALNATPRDDAAVAVAAERFAKMMRRHGESTAFDDIRTAIGDGDVHTAIASGKLKAGMLFTAAGALREQRRVKRNEGAKARRLAKRLDRDRIKSLIGSVDAELRRRKGATEDGKRGAANVAIGPVSSTAAPSKTAPAAEPAPHPQQARRDERDARLAADGNRVQRAQEHMREARTAADGGDFEGAFAHLDQAQELNPERQRLWDKARGIVTGQRDRSKSTATPAEPDQARRAEFDKAVAEDFPPDASVRLFQDWDRDHSRPDLASDVTAVRRARNGYVTVRESKGTTVDVFPRQLELVGSAQGAQSPQREGDDRGSSGETNRSVVPDVPAADVRGDQGQADVLRRSGGASPPADTADSRPAGRAGSGGGDLPGEAGAPERRAASGDREGDAGVPDEPAAPERPGQRAATAGDTGPVDGADAGPDRSGADSSAGGLPGGGRRAEASGEGEREGGDADTAGAPSAPELTEADQPSADIGQVDAIPDTGESFHPTGLDDFAPAGKKSKLEANLAALRTLRQLQDDRRSATPEEQAVLARWAGWGGLPEVFDDNKPEYAKQREELRGLLSDSEWAEARRNTLNAHYTDPRVVQSLWKAMGDLGFDGGRVLEPGSGSGTFIGFAPGNADMVGVELDSTTAAISRALYPHATIRNESYAATRLPAGSFDATIGNVPFGDFALTDRVHNPNRKMSIHNHFIAKALAQTKPGGLVTLLTSRYTLDSKDSAARKKLAELGDLVGAVRLPTGSHSRMSGTDVIEDALIFRRREPDAAPLTSQDWVNSHDQDINGHTVTINDYFTAHPEQVLGEVTAEAGQYGSGSLIVKGDKTMADLPAALDRIVESAKADGITASPRMEGLTAFTTPDDDRHEGHIAAHEDGTFTQAEQGTAVPLDVPAKHADAVRGLIGLRDTLRSLLAAEAASVSDSPDIKALRKQLNDRYDAFVKKYGPVNHYTLTKSGARKPDPARNLFRKDPMSAIVRALGAYDAETGTEAKTSIFRKRASTPREIPTHADSPEDAVALSMDTYGRVDLPAIATMLGTDEAGARERLGDLVFEQPPLSAADADAAFRAHIEEASGIASDGGRFGGISAGLNLDDAPDTSVLDSVGEAVRSEGSLEPAAAYLSGNVRRKLAAAREAAKRDDRFAKNVTALEAVIPPDLGVDEVDGRLGAAWIPADDVRAFMVELLSDGDDPYNSIKVSTSGGGIWTVEGGQWGTKATEEWGTDRLSAGEIIQSLLEQRSIQVRDTIKDADGKSKSYPNLEATTAAQAKAEELSDRFSEWLWEDSDRTRRLLAAYNNQFNAIRLRSYDDMPRVFPGMADSFDPFDHQVGAVNRMVSEPCALLAHVVGAGKTAEMAMGTAELKRLGLANKPAIVIPNHMLEQFSSEYIQIYPNAKILAAGTDDLTGDKRREFVARAATGEWDAIILTQKAMEAIPMSRPAMQAYIDREMATMKAQLASAQASAAGDSAKEKTVKKMENSLIKAEEALKAKLDKVKDAGVSWEETGIDYLCVDEAHMYSNLRTISNIQGAGATGSDMASDLHMKMEHLRANNKSGRVGTFATGTPIRNTVTQAYIMQRYLDPETLRQAGIHSFDQWAATFGKTVDEMELKPEGTGFRQTTRFAKFRNVPELLRLFHLFADVKMADDLNLKTPNLTTGGVQNVIVPASPELSAYVQELGQRAEDVRNGKVKPEEDNMLKISGDGRKAALSMALVGQKHQPGKIEQAADNIYKIWDENKDRPVPKDINDPAGGDDPPPGGMQIVFCDMGTPGGAGMNAYQKLRDELAARGMDPKSIRFMHEAKNDREKAELFAAARNGQVSVLVGSTEKMGVGTNVQRRAVALHHLDAPWRPSDVEQRDGRIMRQGNTNAEVAIFRYVTEGSFDAYMWQTLERKKKFIDQIMRGKMGDVREIEDVGDTALSYAEVKALATGNPLLMDKAKVDVTVGKLTRLERQHARTQTNLRRDVVSYGANAEQADADAAAYNAAIAKRTDISGDKYSINVAGITARTRADGATLLKSAMQDQIRERRYGYAGSKPKPLATIGGHVLLGQPEIHYDKLGTKRFGMTLSWEGLPGTIVHISPDDVDKLGAGINTTLTNSLNNLEFRRDLQVDRATSLRSEAETMKARIGVPFAHAEALKEATAESARLQAAMEAAGMKGDTGPQQDEATKGLATARTKATVKVGHMGRGSAGPEKDRLKRFSIPAASPDAAASPDGTLAALGSGDKLQVFMTSDGELVPRPDDARGAIDNVHALLDDLAALDFPWAEGHWAINRRIQPGYSGGYEAPDYSKPYEERERIRKAKEAARQAEVDAERAKIDAVWKRHLVGAAEEKTAESLVDEWTMLRAARLGVEFKLRTEQGPKPSDTGADGPDTDGDDDVESYEDTVIEGYRYVMDAAGILVKVAPCPECGNDIMIPAYGMVGTAPCPSCGTGALQGRATATVG
jgi:N12 class adenine-specific DNA methylase